MRSETKRRSPRLVLGVLLALGAFVAPVRSEQGPALPSIAWADLQSAVKTAKATNKPVFVNVYADWCGYCRKMEQTTFRDAAVVAKLNSQFVLAKLNGESSKKLLLGKATMTESEWAMRQGVQGFPALIVLDAKGRTVVHYPGFLDSPTAMAFLGELGTFFKGGGIDKLGGFVEWSEKQRG